MPILSKVPKFHYWFDPQQVSVVEIERVVKKIGPCFRKREVTDHFLLILDEEVFRFRRHEIKGVKAWVKSTFTEKKETETPPVKKKKTKKK